MARRSYLKVLGVIENMSTFTCEHGTEYALFGEGGGTALATDIGVPLLGRVPLEPAVSAANDSGEPLSTSAPDSAAGQAFAAIASRISDELLPPVDMAGCTARMLDAIEAKLGAS
jgi:ATP-binding protein involved in chromosome partitioning